MARSVPLELTDPGPLAEMYTLSPFVWRANGRYKLLLRAVNRAEREEDKVARIHYGESEDGLQFRMDHQPVIAPGPGPEDQDGCEDPTVAVVDDTLYVYYTGWNQAKKEGQLLLAAGPSPDRLQRRRVAIASSEAFQNPKEASIAPCEDGTWRLFFEYATQGASRIGIAFADSVEGPWTMQASPFTVRDGSWDSWHLSPGPILLSDPSHPVMFYNGSTEEIAWRVGWIMFDAGYTRVVARCEQPLFEPPAPDPGYRDIAFAASSVQRDGDIWLYYSLADKDMMRGTLRQSPDPTCLTRHAGWING
jgi:beta-1,2-mannobiose phosphorylase / 1,2-beta-oligomannan phosphorylase